MHLNFALRKEINDPLYTFGSKKGVLKSNFTNIYNAQVNKDRQVNKVKYTVITLIRIEISTTFRA